MLTKEQLKEIEDRANDAGTHLTAPFFYKPDVNDLLNHIKELTQKAYCEHSWVYYFDGGFKCMKCAKVRGDKR